MSAYIDAAEFGIIIHKLQERMKLKDAYTLQKCGK